MRKGLTFVTLAVVLAASGCSGGSGAPSSPRHVPLPPITTTDTPMQRAGKLARYIEARWPRIRVEQADASDDGTVVGFQDWANYDASIQDPKIYEDHVRRLTGDLTQASVELLKLTARFFPHLQYATVWQDRQLEAFWSRDQILRMGNAETYRDYKSFLRLVLSAQYPPAMAGLSQP